MNSEELKKEFGLLMPSEINGFKRPDESISSSNDFFLEIPQLISKDPVLYSTMNLIFSVILSNDKLLKQWLDTLQNVVNAQDWRVVTDSLKGYMTPELKKKLDGIATGANNYVHPSNHPATMITQDATHRFVSDTEKNTWNAKASTAVVSTTANGLAPKRDGNASHFLAGDGTWKVVPSASSATSATKATQDSRGQQIDTTYIKGVTGSNATLTVTKGNGSTSTVTVNNVANATTANNLVLTDGTSAHIKYGGGDVDENTAISQNKVNLLIGSWFSTGFRDLCSTGNPIRVAINHRNGNIKTTGNVIANGAMYSATPATTDNSTRVATTEFVRNLINQFKNDGTLGGIVGGSLTQNGWVKFSNGLILQWGSGGKGTKTLPIVYTKWYIPVVAYGNNINWQPENSAVTAYKVSLSQLNIWAKEGSNFWFITVGI